MQERRLLQYLTLSDIPSSASIATVNATGNVLYLPITGKDSNNVVLNFRFGKSASSTTSYFYATVNNFADRIQSTYNSYSKVQNMLYSSNTGLLWGAKATIIEGSYKEEFILLAPGIVYNTGTSTSNTTHILECITGYIGYVKLTTTTLIKVISIGTQIGQYPVYIDTE